jgi:hypothetical protein
VPEGQRAQTGGDREPADPRRLSARIRERLIPGRDAEGIVYGTITMGALLAAEQARSETYPKTIIGVALALGLVWAAHTYAAVLGERMRERGERGASAVTPNRGDAQVPQSDQRRRASAAPAGDEDAATARHWRRFMGHQFAVLKGGVLPLAALFASWAFGASLSSAIIATLWTCVATLILVELAAGLRASARPALLALQVLVGASLGGAVLLLEVILH